jgi:hypothetical protein
MKPKIVQRIWYETKSRPSYHVLFQQDSGPNSALGHGVPLDPTNRYTRVDTGTHFHLTSTKSKGFMFTQQTRYYL